MVIKLTKTKHKYIRHTKKLKCISVILQIVAVCHLYSPVTWTEVFIRTLHCILLLDCSKVIFFIYSFKPIPFRVNVTCSYNSCLSISLPVRRSDLTLIFMLSYFWCLKTGLHCREGVVSGSQHILPVQVRVCESSFSHLMDQNYQLW